MAKNRSRNSRQPVELPRKVAGPLYIFNLGCLVLALFFGVWLVNYTIDAVGMQVQDKKGGSGQVQISRCEHRRFGSFHCVGNITQWNGDEFTIGDTVDVISRSEHSGTVAVDARTVSVGRRPHRDSGYREYTDYSVVAPSDDWVMPDTLRLFYMVGTVIGCVLVVWLLLWPINWAIMKRYRTNEPPGSG